MLAAIVRSPLALNVAGEEPKRSRLLKITKPADTPVELPRCASVSGGTRRSTARSAPAPGATAPACRAGLPACWSYAEVLPFFKNIESYAGGGDDAFRGREGPLRVTNPEPRDPLLATIIKAAAEVGIRHNPDYNGASQEGIAMSQATIAAGRRMSTARCYLDPVRKRRNLHIETEALTEGLVLGGKRCTGVRYSVAGDVREARRGRAVVVSAG